MIPAKYHNLRLDIFNVGTHFSLAMPFAPASTMRFAHFYISFPNLKAFQKSNSVIWMYDPSFSQWIVSRNGHIPNKICSSRWLGRMMTSWNGSIFRVTDHLCGEFPGEFPAQRPVTRSFDVFFHLRLNKRSSKQSWSWWFETPSRPFWRHYNAANIWTKCLEYWSI